MGVSLNVAFKKYECSCEGERIEGVVYKTDKSIDRKRYTYVCI